MVVTPGGDGPTIAVVGNCQARPLAQIIQAMLPNAVLTEPVIVHLARPAEEEAVMERLSGADVILAQLVADNYPVPFVRNSALKEAFGERVFLWLNLFYRGYNPELTYYRQMPNADRRFPLGDYHIRTVYEAFQAGLGVGETVARLADPDWNRQTYGAVAAESLEELRRREAPLPVKIVDDIAEREAHERLFFTFNHPALQLLADYAAKLLGALGLAPRFQIVNGMIGEPLSQIVVPVNPGAALRSERMRSYRIVPRAAEGASGPRPFLLSEAEVVERFFVGYRQSEARIAS
ncbi:WcbI family polysaccharide biosynthesis putative acetyltransferase [Acuticoccus sediminis]|uniref:WcbI family polysaccharide biosynthesis putative acetyltransferase n=1 Tax=Acuticoccus sediminis TaxID=2184697 RepID=UPI001CFD8531|nr:WcbI family polysaccharide biosynthesis putative acetyltransferase [Acuticoccus sediminis]